MKRFISPLKRIAPSGTRALVVTSAVLVAAGISAPVPAGATFGGSDGNVAFVSNCDAAGQAVDSVNPVGSPPPTYTCPGGANPYTQSTAGSADSMPSFSSQGNTLYFASNRPGSGSNPGASGNFAIYQVAYPSTGLSGTPGSQTDGATQITFPSGASSDYAPTVSADGNELSFLRCNAGPTSCVLYIQNPIVNDTPTPVATSVPPLLPDPNNGAAGRPEIDPADPTQILYVGNDNHIHLVSTTSAFTERDLSSESGLPSGQVDEYPDWNPAGTNVIFDRSHVVEVLYGINPTAGTASACQLWTVDPGTEIEPIYAPSDTATASAANCNPAGNEYVWTKLGGGSNIVLDMGHAVGNPDALASLTSNRLLNNMPAWQPVAPFVGAPEVPMALLLPALGGLLLAGTFVLDRRRKRLPVVAEIAA